MYWGNVIKGNPVIQRYRNSVMRPGPFRITLAIYLI